MRAILKMACNLKEKCVFQRSNASGESSQNSALRLTKKSLVKSRSIEGYAKETD